MKVRDAIKLVESRGWELVRTRGSHRQYHHPVKPGTVTIAGHPSLDLDPRTQASREAIEFHIEGMRLDGEVVPPPTMLVEQVEIPA
jgi:predicted RNA binding protein YcfA (HicA-like mRNA interferase family)